MADQDDAQASADDKAGKAAQEAPWSVRGVTPRNRAKVIKAAKDASISIGDYLNRAIQEKGVNDRLAKKAEAPVLPPVDQGRAMAAVEMVERLAGAGLTISRPQQTKVLGLVGQFIDDVKVSRHTPVAPKQITHEPSPMPTGEPPQHTDEDGEHTGEGGPDDQTGEA